LAIPSVENLYLRWLIFFNMVYLLNTNKSYGLPALLYCTESLRQ
jgi:hypothetical protein